jgi:hypothetical protein
MAEETNERYLIAHKVRGEVAFDVAEQMWIDKDNFWWIIPTSGHRAYPFWYMELEIAIPMHLVPPMPEDLRDHYTVLEALERRIGRVRPPAANTDGGITPNLEDI